MDSAAPSEMTADSASYRTGAAAFASKGWAALMFGSVMVKAAVAAARKAPTARRGLRGMGATGFPPDRLIGKVPISDA
ncbi:hypothetical protein GCM10017744_066990 [Streptomyces antimycoticus]|uniref:Uncharacterized protein n=1 Tax=Streptomyces antimycoticus TaxID=68175 RepID=A0A4D4K7I1_9ACTN|nr:hypothetical protein SANT12839_035000 [Streptomyces antimycoticus]